MDVSAGLLGTNQRLSDRTLACGKRQEVSAGGPEETGATELNNAQQLRKPETHLGFTADVSQIWMFQSVFLPRP